MDNKNWFLKGGRGSGRTFRLLCETFENKIADIKANCDLAIEGRDVKIKELEQKLEQTEKDLADYQFNYPTIKELEEENERLKGDLELWESGGCRATNLFECGVVKELKEQIEKMKCCENCGRYWLKKCNETITACSSCNDKNMWRFKE